MGLFSFCRKEDCMDRNEYDAAKRFNATMTVFSRDFTRFVDEIAKLREAIERKNMKRAGRGSYAHLW